MPAMAQRLEALRTSLWLTLAVVEQYSDSRVW
jgi:hypothetical protein